MSETANKNEKINDSIEKIPIKINLLINSGNYIYSYMSLKTGNIEKISRKILKKTLILKQNISTSGNLNIGSFNIKLETFKGKNKEVKIIYSITKLNNKFSLNFYKSFGKGEIDSQNFVFKKGEKVSGTIKFKRKGKGGFNKDLNNLSLNITFNT